MIVDMLVLMYDIYRVLRESIGLFAIYLDICYSFKILFLMLTIPASAIPPPRLPHPQQPPQPDHLPARFLQLFFQILILLFGFQKLALSNLSSLLILN